MFFKKKIFFIFLSFLLLNEVLSATLVSTEPSSEDDDLDKDDLDDSDEIEDDGKIYKNPRNSPSAACPRDEEQATLLGQKCLRKCSSDEDCKSKKKKCLCDGACGMSCIKPDRECPELPDPEYGRVSVTGKLFGDRATYTCTHGYHVVGLQSRTCQADGQWAGQAPSCKQNIYCLSPPNIDHARHNALPEQATFDLDSTLQYYCHTGYVTNGFPRAKCLAIDGQASWYGPDISCEPRSCGPPPDLAHGWHAGECYTYGCRVMYHCAEGFELVGKSERFCQADGTWSPKDMPTCVLVTAVQCPPPENPRNGKAIYTSCSYNSVVSYECKYGYTLVGESTRKCGADRKWTGTAPQCKEINCGFPGRLWNGWLENVEGGTGLGASIIFRCHEGTRLEGHSSTVCQIDGTWRYPLPKCLAPCVVPSVSQGRVILLNQPNDTFYASTVVQHGEALTVECESQYEFHANINSPVICNNGTWTVIPKCTPARCKHLPKPPKNGMVIAPKMEHGMRAKFRCKDGFTLKGNHFVECSFGNWTGEYPYCQEVYCPFPGYVENGKVLLVGNMGLYDYRPYVRKIVNNKQIMYECEKGYVLLEGPPGATCIGGHWSPKDLPRCVLGQHPRLRWSRRRRSIALQQYRRALLGQKAANLYIRMKRSLERKEHHQRKHLRQHSHENSNRRLRTHFDDWYYFQRGKRTPKLKMGASTSVRQRNNLKSIRRKDGTGRGRKKSSGAGDADEDDVDDELGELPPERPKKHTPCEVLSSEPYVNIEFVKQGKDPNVTYSQGTVVRVACGKGYVLNMESNNTAKCVKGRWKPMKPECLILPCHVPSTANGFYVLSNPEHISATGILLPTKPRNILNETFDIKNGQVVEFSCYPGYNVIGPTNLRCWHGEWTVTSLPKCSAAPCQLPEISNGQYLSGYRAGLMIANGSSVTFQCDNDYSKSTAQPVECILGELYPRSPACKQKNAILAYNTESPHFLGGSDIIKGGDISALDFELGLNRGCGPPARVQGSLVYRNGEPVKENDKNFPEGTEITFHCIESIMGERTTWRIICEDGSWIGRSLNCAKPLTDADELLAHQLANNNNTCIFRNQEPNVVSFYNDQQIREDIVEFPNGAELVSRCVDIGKYAMIGSNRRKCVGGEWDGQKPSCFGLNQENDYAMEKPPTVLFRHQLGPIAQSNDGKLIVYPGTILHMECLWIRRFGNPKWNVSHDYRKYPEGWTQDPGRDPQLEYRLSIYHAARDDSGIFTCITPARHSHSVEIEVKAVHCPAITNRRGLTVSSQSTKMNTKLTFSCANGNSLIGATEIICLPSGNWSAPFPICESIECGDVISGEGDVGGPSGLGPHLRVAIVSREVGGRAVFSCSPGFGLRGPHETVCTSSGEWAQPFPTCSEVQCETPGEPENGYIQGSGPYKAGDVVQFNCNPDFMMEGQPIIACQDNSRWSGPLPKCVQACSYPGTTISGRMSSVKFYYKIGENITFTCDDGLILRGASMLKCLRNGKWSNAIPTCVSPDSER